MSNWTQQRVSKFEGTLIKIIQSEEDKQMKTQRGLSN